MEAKLDQVILGCDLGKIRDYTALCAVEQYQNYSTWPEDGSEVGDPYFHLVYLERFPLHTDYDDIISYTKLIYDDAVERYANQRKKPELVVDATGPGLPMLDHFKKVLPKTKGVYITGGSSVNQEGSLYYVPKQHLATNLQIVLQGRNLKFGRNVKETVTLKKELMNFSYKINDATGNTTFEHWREGDKDDTVLAVAIALWYALKGQKRITRKMLNAGKMFRGIGV